MTHHDRRKIALQFLILMSVLFLWLGISRAMDASWYSVESLKREGTWGKSQGRMANGKMFRDDAYTAASRKYPLGTMVRISCGPRSVKCRITDRIGKRFTETRIDLSKRAFSQLADLKRGIIPVKIEVVK